MKGYRSLEVVDLIDIPGPVSFRTEPLLSAAGFTLAQVYYLVTHVVSECQRLTTRSATIKNGSAIRS